MSLLEAVGRALSEGKGSICVVCDLPQERHALISRLGSAFGPVPLTDHDYRGREPGIWDLCCPNPKVHFAHWASSLTGRGFDAIIVLNRSRMEEVHGLDPIKNWVDTVLRCRLLPEGTLTETFA